VRSTCILAKARSTPRCREEAAKTARPTCLGSAHAHKKSEANRPRGRLVYCPRFFQSGARAGRNAPYMGAQRNTRNKSKTQAVRSKHKIVCEFSFVLGCDSHTCPFVFRLKALFSRRAAPAVAAQRSARRSHATRSSLGARTVVTAGASDAANCRRQASRRVGQKKICVGSGESKFLTYDNCWTIALVRGREHIPLCPHTHTLAL
jgi:hypothetical protein